MRLRPPRVVGDQRSAPRARLNEATLLQRGKGPSHGRHIDAQRARNFAVRREPFAFDQLAPSNSFADRVGQALIDRAIIVRQFELVEHP